MAKLREAVQQDTDIVNTILRLYSGVRGFPTDMKFRYFVDFIRIY